MFAVCRRTNPQLLTEFGSPSTEYPAYTGIAVKPRVSVAFLRQIQRRYRQSPPEFVPAIDPGLTTGYPEYTGQTVRGPRAAPALLRQVQRRYQQYPQMPVPTGPGLTAGYQFQGEARTQPPRASAAFLNRAKRKNEQMSPWGMLGGTVPPIGSNALVPVRIQPRMTLEIANRLKRRYRPSDVIPITGPGLTARPPFQGSAYGPRFTARDFLIRARRYREEDPRAALSGLKARGVGSFVGAKLGHLTVTATRECDALQITATRSATLTVQ